MRDILYFASMMERQFKNRSLLSRKLQRIPTPHFVVFYNGCEAEAEYRQLKLSDAFMEPVDKPDIELVCHVYNINHGYNRELLERCPVLKEYMILVDKVRNYCDRGINLDETVRRAIDECIEEGVLNEFLILHRTEVEDMIRIDGTWEEYEELIKQESFEDGMEQGVEIGREQGMEIGREQGMESGLKIGRENCEKIMSLLNLSEEEKDRLRRELAK